jgi:hypothetical protein
MAKKPKVKTGVKTGGDLSEAFKEQIFKKGQSGNPNGRPLGQRNYATIYREALIQLAKKKGTTPEGLENLILQVGIAKAIGGDYRFYQDLMDRTNGKPIQRNELTGADGKDLIPDTNSLKTADQAIDEYLNDNKRNTQ